MHEAYADWLLQRLVPAVSEAAPAAMPNGQPADPPAEAEHVPSAALPLLADAVR